MTRLCTGRGYHEFMLASKSDNQARAAFQNVVLSLAPPSAAILDFGAGTGIDAKVYAQYGCHVYAYDVSREMQEYLAEYCRGEIESGDLRSVEASYDDLLAQGDLHGLDAITANFAVLNLIRDHGPLFQAFDRWLAPKGFVLVSVINPYCIGDARYRWWWENLFTLVRGGRYSVGSGDGISYRYSLSTMRDSARPHFVLERVFPSSTRRSSMTPPRRESLSERAWGPFSLCMHPFMFLLFRKA